MKLAKRLLVLLLAVLMLPVWTPAVAQALELPGANNTDSCAIPARVNPNYAHIYTLDDFDRPTLQKPASDYSTYATYVTMEQGTNQMRENLKNRVETFTIYVKTADSNVNRVANTLFNDAMEHTGKPTEGDYLQWHWSTVEADYDSVLVSGEYMYSLYFGVTYYTTAAQEKKVDTAVKNLISSLGVSGKSDYAKISAVYDYICENVTYDHANLNDDSYTLKFSAYAALINKTAVCQGYALLFYRLMLELGIDARFIGGIGNGGAHGWNIVELNGLYYNVDSTWDAGMSEYSFFLTNTVSFVDHYRYLDYASWEFHEEYPMAAENYASGATNEIDPYIYIYPCGDNAAFAVERDGTLTIAGEGEIWDYYPSSSVDDDASLWHFWGEHITKLVVEDGITVLGNGTFYDMDSLNTIQLPGTLTSIGSDAFEGCEGLDTVKIPKGVTAIGRYAFASTSITKLTLPDTLIRIDGNAFRYCEKLKAVIIPDSVTSIGLYAFAGCDSLTSIVIPESVTSLGDSAFAYCDNLASAEVYCKKISGDLFQDCDKLTELVLHNTVEINSCGLRCMDGLEEIYIPATVTEVGNYAFESNASLTSIYFTGDAPFIDSYAFKNCKADVYYPMGNETWTEVVKENYRGNITWIPRVCAPVVKASNVASTGKIKLTWDAVPGAVKYEVYRSATKNGTYKKLITTTSTSLTINSAEVGETFCYKVRSVDEDGKKSDFSTIVSRTCDLPRPEVTLTCIASSGKIKLTWTAVEGAKKYEVYRSTDKQNWTKLITTTGTSLTNSSAEAGTLYYYRVRAIHENSAANSAYSAIKSKRCDLPRPVITLSNIASTGKIMISWKPIEGAVKYQVYRSTDNENWTRLITTTGTSLTNSSAEAGVLYYYKVRAIASNSEANSAYSTVKSRTCDLAQPVLTVELNAAGKPYLTWTALDGAVKYRVDRSTDGENWTRLITTTGTKLTNSSAEAGITYYYRIFAISSNSSANSAYSEIVSITAG